jgi:hypothetical protein
MWSLISGRELRRGVRPEQLGEEELIAFWADDFYTPGVILTATGLNSPF